MAEQNVQQIISAMQVISAWSRLKDTWAPDQLLTWAKGLGSYFAQQRLSTQYARRMLAGIIKAEQQCVLDDIQGQRTHAHEAQRTHAHEDLFFLLPRLSYKVAKVGNGQRQGYQTLLDAYSALLQVQSLKAAGQACGPDLPYAHELLPELRKVREFFQALIAYHEVYQGPQSAQPTTASQPPDAGEEHAG